MALHLSQVGNSEVKSDYGNIEGKSSHFRVFVEAIVAKTVEVNDTEAPKVVRTEAINALADRVREAFVKQIEVAIV